MSRNLTLIGQNSNLEIDLRYFKLKCSGPADLAPSNYVSFVKDRCPHNSLITLQTAFIIVRLKVTPKLGFKARCPACTEHRKVATAFKAQGICEWDVEALLQYSELLPSKMVGCKILHRPHQVYSAEQTFWASPSAEYHDHEITCG